MKQSENVEHIEDANIADQLPDVPIEDPERIREKVKVDGNDIKHTKNLFLIQICNIILFTLESKRVALEA